MGLCIALHIIPFPQTYLEFNHYSFNVTHSPPLFTLDLSIILQSVAETGSFLAVIMLLMFPVFIFGFIFLIKRRTSGDITLLILSSTLIVDFILLVRLKPGYYAIYVAPILQIVAANYLLHIQDTPWSGHWADYLGRIAWGLVFVSIGLNLFMLRQNSYTSYAANQNGINSLAETGVSSWDRKFIGLGLPPTNTCIWSRSQIPPLSPPGNVGECPQARSPFNLHRRQPPARLR